MSKRYASSSRMWPTTTCSSAAARGGWTRLSRPFCAPASRLRTSTSNVSPTDCPCRDLRSKESHATHRLRHLVHDHDRGAALQLPHQHQPRRLCGRLRGAATSNTFSTCVTRLRITAPVVEQERVLGRHIEPGQLHRCCRGYPVGARPGADHRPGWQDLRVPCGAVP